jgi:glycogen debranching enzyme
VRSSTLTIVRDRTFMLTDERGEILTDRELGLFAGDTRFVSRYQLFINNQPWKLLGSASVSHHAARLHFLNPAFVIERGEVAGGEISLTVTRSVADGVHEDLDITNYSMSEVSFELELVLQSDFADIFEVKEGKRGRRARVRKRWDGPQRELHSVYVNGDFRRRLIYRLERADSEPHYAAGRLRFPVGLAPGASWHACGYFVLIEGDVVREPLSSCYAVSFGDSASDKLEQEWQDQTTHLSSGNPDVDLAFAASIEDIGTLRLYDDDLAPDIWLPAAGVPWFVALFGRDSLTVSLQSMIVQPSLAIGALQKLGMYQATKFDDWRDAQPGKILHELRTGELAHLHLIPHTPYFGTADATALYLILLHEAWKWLGDTDILRVHQATALRCLEWIDQLGDLDGDGFQEYQTRSTRGYENMGWKDSGDAIVYPDGSQVRQPKALCELQGYVFDAKMRMAEAFEALNDGKLAAGLREEALDLRHRFEAAFWCEEIGSYALGLDPEKTPIRTVASNAGHCLWSGIASPQHAARVVSRLTEEDMWSGWGIRTLSSENPAYNPFSYQRGSVWPHDNGLIALGFKRYGFHNEVNGVARDLFRAASYHESHRLPELYAGLPRGPGAFPVHYPGANLPQAWAAACVFHLIQAILGIQANAPRGELYVDPALPDWLPDLRVQGLRIGQARVDLHFWRDGAGTSWEIENQLGEIAVRQRAWEPWADA